MKIIKILYIKFPPIIIITIKSISTIKSYAKPANIGKLMWLQLVAEIIWRMKEKRLNKEFSDMEKDLLK
jgi:hypothetical protein